MPARRRAPTRGAPTSFGGPETEELPRPRVDLGLALKNTKTPKRLTSTGGFAEKDRMTHRTEISSLADIDDELRRWMKTAYEMDRD